MGVKVNVDLSRLNRRLSRGNLIKGRKGAANEAHAAMNQFVPKLHDSGTTLRNNSFISRDGKEIIYQQPYAKAQFYGFVGKNGARVRHYTTPGTSRRWDLRLKARQDLMNNVTNAMKKGLDL